MKKIIITLAIFIGSIAAVTAQPRAIGLRLGYFLEASYQHSISDKGFLQIDAGTAWFSSGTATLTYNHIVLEPNINWGKMCLSVGGGVGGGYYWGFASRYYGYYGYGWRYGWAGVAPIVQFAFTFPFPLQVAVDYRPNLGVRIYGKDYDYYSSRIGFNINGLFDAAFSVRYAF